MLHKASCSWNVPLVPQKAGSLPILRRTFTTKMVTIRSMPQNFTLFRNSDGTDENFPWGECSTCHDQDQCGVKPRTERQLECCLLPGTRLATRSFP